MEVWSVQTSNHPNIQSPKFDFVDKLNEKLPYISCAGLVFTKPIMKIAVLSDIHANFNALIQVEQHIRAWKPNITIDMPSSSKIE